MFTVEIIVKSKENRRSQRQQVDIPGRITTEENWRSVCRIADLSRHGVRLSTFSALAKNTVVWINLPGLPARKGEIVWADEYNAACKFYEPMNDVDVASLVDRYGFEVEVERPLESMIMVA